MNKADHGPDSRAPNEIPNEPYRPGATELILLLAMVVGICMLYYKDETNSSTIDCSQSDSISKIECQPDPPRH